MKVYKALIYIILLIFSLVSVSSFAASKYYVDVYECIRDSDGKGTSINLDNLISTSANFLTTGNNKLLLYKIKSNFVAWHAQVGCLLTDEPEPEPEKPIVIESCDYGSKQEDMTPTVQGDWTAGVHQHNSTSYAFRIETSTDIKYACDVLHRYDVICHTDNPLAVAQFNVDLIKDFPKYNNSVQMAFQGCLYDALLTQDLDNKWSGECYNATFYRTDSPADQIGNVDFTPYACEEKTCPQGQQLDEQGICQNNVVQCPVGQHSEGGNCVDIPALPLTYRMFNCFGQTSYDTQFQCQSGNRFSSFNSFVSYLKQHDERDVYSYQSAYIHQEDYIVVPTVFYRSGSQRREQDLTTDIYLHAGFVKEYKCNSGSSVQYHAQISGCRKVCPNNIEVSFLDDCSTTIVQCPDGSSVNNDQNCPTKICPDQSEIPFDYTCPTGGDGDGGGNGGNFDITPLLAKQDKIIENQQYSIDETNNLKTHLSSEHNPAKTNVDGSVGFYQPQYSDGLQTVLDKHSDIFEQSEVNEYMEKWNVEAHGDKPDMNFCFDIPDVGDLGCHELKIDNYVFAFMRIILIVTSLFAARFIVFGG